MADRLVDYLIVGGGIAGAACAEALREGDATASILLVGREPDPPYERPPASKEYLRGDATREDALVFAPAWWEQQRVELLTRTSVMKLDTEARTATLSTKEEVGYGAALLATGANVKRLRVPGSELEGIHYLRALGNSDAIRNDAAEAERVVLIGGSYIACEVSASLTSLGKQCTLVMLEDGPLSTGFGPTASGFFERVLREHGVECVCGDPLASFAGEEGGRVQEVVTESGRRIPADMVVMGTGAMPDVMLARSAGLELGDSGGVRCSSSLATSADGVWAAGDVCEYDSVVHGRRLRVEHFEVARAQGRAAAESMQGRGSDYTEIPYFWSDLADWCTLEYVGPAESWDDEELRGSLEDGEFTIFYRDGERVVAALTVGRSDDLDEARRLIAEG
jgi:3-phenylpropionate/trans-cinnamate dioxygenase ferredoxin reductase subunit